ncbi:MAG: ribosome maturation factor RimM [Bdellovibrionota bacterium]
MSQLKSDKKSESRNGFVTVGKMKDAHGIRGELFIVLFAGEAEWLTGLKTIRLIPPEGATGEMQEFSVKSIRPHKNGMIVKSGDLSDRNQAEALKGKLLEVPESFLISKPGETVFLREVLGFEVSTEDKGVIGKVVEFSSNTAQDLLVVKAKSGTYEIPFVEAFVKNIDYDGKKILLDLPLGLLGELDDEVVEKETDIEPDGDSEDQETDSPE